MAGHPGEELVTTTCPRDCYDTCGMTVVKRDGRRHAPFAAIPRTP